MIKVEFHSHTAYSKDSLTSPESIIKICQKKGIDQIVITDHNTISGARIAHKIRPDVVIIGEEIMTTQGELLAAFVKEEIPSGLEPLITISLLREQEAFISVSHPFDVWRSGHWSESNLLAIVPHIDAIEVFNARCMKEIFNRQASEFARNYNLLGTVGSDAHALFEIGKATVVLPEFSDATSLKRSLHQATYQTTLSSPWIHFTSRYAVWRKKFQSYIGKPLPKP